MFFFFQAEDGIRDPLVTGVQTCALPICAAGQRGGAALEVRAAESGGQSAGGGKAGCPVAALSAFAGKGDLPDQAARGGRKYARSGQSTEFVRTAYARDPQRERAYAERVWE